MGLIDAVGGVVNAVTDRVWRLKQWAEPHLWVMTTTTLVIAVPLIIASEVDKARVLAYSGRLRDKLLEEKKDAAGSELDSKLIAMNTGTASKEVEEEF